MKWWLIRALEVLVGTPYINLLSILFLTLFIIPLEGTVLLLFETCNQIAQNTWENCYQISFNFISVYKPFNCALQCWWHSGEAEWQSVDHGAPGGERLQWANPGSEERWPGHVHACPHLLHQWCGELCWWGIEVYYYQWRILLYLKTILGYFYFTWVFPFLVSLCYLCNIYGGKYCTFHYIL